MNIKTIYYMPYLQLPCSLVVHMWKISLIALFFPCGLLYSQELQKDVKLPTNFGIGLFSEIPDFRFNFFTEQQINDRIKRGVICVVRSGSVSEHSFEYCKTVAVALKEISLVDRNTSRPQIRIVGKRSILQSEVNYPSVISSSGLSGFSTDFLQHKLEAGDLIIICQRC
jgi:hypothetical protein